MDDFPRWRLQGEPSISERLRGQLVRDFERFAQDGLPDDLDDYLRDQYRVDLRSQVADLPIRNPWGKASGQLSMTAVQVADDARAGLGFVVLKTLIAQDAAGAQSMKEWAIPESRMAPERITGRRSGRTGWTITWKGRGWWQSLDDYLALVRESVAIGGRHSMLVVPSCKYHLPTADEPGWKEEEYAYTTRRLVEAYHAGAGSGNDSVPMPIEKDFSPTLAGSDRARAEETILTWLERVPDLLRRTSSTPLRIGLKLFNALFEDEFQVRMLCQVLDAPASSRPDFVTYANRLFDPDRTFEGKKGVAFGGPDLSERNLTVLDAYWSRVRAGTAPAPSIPLSATGDIHSGRMAMEYVLRGCSSLQIHTYFQLPSDAYVMRSGSKVQKALHVLYFHPTDGFLAWLRAVGEQQGQVQSDGTICFRDLVGFQQ